MKTIVIFASGSGSNAEKIITYFKNAASVCVAEVYSNKFDAKVLDVAFKNKIKTTVFSKTELNNGLVLNKLQHLQPDLIVLAGFLLQFPKSIVDRFPNQIINIHPALLPKYGGKGMYGIRVHQAVLDHHEAESGITIHYVNQDYDDGAVIFQKSVSIKNCTSAEEIAQKILNLEHQYFSEVIANLLSKK